MAEVLWHIVFKKLGYQFTRNDIDVLYQQFLTVADNKKEVEDEDLQELAKEFTGGSSIKFFGDELWFTWHHDCVTHLCFQYFNQQ